LIDTSILLGDPALELRRPQPWSLRQSRLHASPSLLANLLPLELDLVNAETTPLSGVTITLAYDPRRITGAETPGATGQDGVLTWTLDSLAPLTTTTPITLSPASLGDATTTVTATLQVPHQLDVVLPISLTLPPVYAAFFFYFPLYLQD